VQVEVKVFSTDDDSEAVFSPVRLWTPGSRKAVGIKIASDKLSRFCLAYIYIRHVNLAPGSIKEGFSELTAAGKALVLGAKAGEGGNFEKASRLAKKPRVEMVGGAASELRTGVVH
jgi:hypothetical protein